MSTSDQTPLVDKTVQHSKEAKDIAVDQIRLAATIGSQAVTSGVYLYPIQGMYYILRHPSIWKPIRKPIFISLIMSFFITGAMFMFTYLPQAAFLTLFNGPFAFIAAIPLVLGESGTLINFLARAFWLAPALDNVFDQVLLQQGMTSLVAQGREIQGQGKGKSLGKALSAPLNRFTKEGIIQYLLSLPLNFIPIVGTVFFLFYNGNRTGPGHHERYFQLKHFSPNQKKEFIASNKGSYTAFGTACMALNLIPGVSIFFAFAASAGAALWATDIEKRQGTQVDTNASAEATQDLTDVGKKTE